MTNTTPYSDLKREARAYEILLLRDQQESEYADIAKRYGITAVRVTQIYNKIKIKQIRLYLAYLAEALGHENLSQIRKVFDDALDCYQDWSFACAYLEKTYPDLLNEYRAGEPGMCERFLKSLPPFTPPPDQATVARVVEMREKKRATYIAIGRELHITPAKAKHIYDMFYHEQFNQLVQALLDQAESDQEKRAIWENCYGGYKSSKRRYDELAEKRPSSAEGPRRM